jgi:hypothetical protein
MGLTKWIWRAVGTVALASSLPTMAKLHWESVKEERVLPVGVDLVEIKFAFSNRGQHSVTIVRAEPSCGCTVPSLEKYTFAPEEKGVMTVLFDGKNLTGVQEKTIHVVTDDMPNATTLTLRVTIPDWITVTPRFLTWVVGEELEAKESLLVLNPKGDIKITSTKPNSPNLSATLEPGKEPGNYRLIAKPAFTVAPLQSYVTITMEIPGATTRTSLLIVLVR